MYLYRTVVCAAWFAAMIQGCGSESPASSSRSGDVTVADAMAGQDDAGMSGSADTRSVGEPDEGAPGPDAQAPSTGISETQITVGAYVFDARVAGPDDGELVLLLHGFPQTSIEYEAQLIALADAGYRAVAPNQRG